MKSSATARRILGNFFTLSAGEFLARVVHFAAFAYLARVLGSGEFGRVGIVLTVVSYLMIAVAQGFDSVGIRDVARDRILLGPYAGTILAIRLVSAAVVWLGLREALKVGQLDPQMRSLLLLFALTLFTSAVSLKWAFQAVERTRAVAAAGIVAQLGFAAGAFTVRGPQHVLRLPVAQLAGEAAGAVVLAGVFLRRFGGFPPSLEWRLWRTLLRESAPLAVSTVLGTLLFNFDVLALAYFRTASEVGLYTAVYKLVLVFTTLVTLFQLSLFPTLARAYQERHDLEAIVERALNYLAVIFVPLAFGGLLFAPRLIEWVLGAGYAAGSGPLKILLWSLPWMALRAVFRIILVSYNLQGLDVSAMLAGTVTNVALDLLLVPRLGATGAAISTLCSEFIILHQSYRAVWRNIQPVFVLKHLYRPAIGSAVMMVAALALWWTPAVMRAAAATGIYLVVMRFLGAVRWKEIAQLWAADRGSGD